MNGINLGLVIILATSVATVTSAGMNEYCEDPLICTEKPEIYDSVTGKMKDLFYKNEKLIKVTQQSVDRSDDGITETPQGSDENCWSITTLEAPFAVKSLNTSTSDLVVQLYDPDINFVQKIKYTRCLNDNLETPCLKNIFGDSSVARCKEKMSAVSLYIYDPVRVAMVYKMFEIPVACVCKFPS